MKLVTTLFLVIFSFFAASAQELESKIELNTVNNTVENVSLQVINKTQLPLLILNKSIIAKKKSYKYIIENTLSGRKNLIFKTKRSTKIC